MHAHGRGDVGERDLADAALGTELAGRIEDRLFPLLLGLCAAGALESGPGHHIIIGQPRCIINATVFH